MTRNPKDAAISFYHHFRHLHLYTGSKDDFLSAFVTDQVLYSPINDHVLEFWKLRSEPNILFLFYEDMKRNLEAEVTKTMKFLNKTYTKAEIDKLCQHLSFESMSKNPSCNLQELTKELKESRMVDERAKKEEFCFIRKGRVGSYKEELTQEQEEILNKMVDDPKLKVEGFSYKF